MGTKFGPCKFCGAARSVESRLTMCDKGPEGSHFFPAIYPVPAPPTRTEEPTKDQLLWDVRAWGKAQQDAEEAGDRDTARRCGNELGRSRLALEALRLREQIETMRTHIKAQEFIAHQNHNLAVDAGDSSDALVHDNEALVMALLLKKFNETFPR